ncbi:hypothetical protein [Tichowtungia aerotolerans]|uniref:histidine kinase n=1 Tax=Tichowtungia aerotolerans TaxID=2697043 RepID=A0A6P1M4Z3_9BACT|nr:hypothetical protein [Tichowtungia aerotolerans]QHI69650.1 hypothetical protein GT409_09330 [Tichowtungia aerotolerans]
MSDPDKHNDPGVELKLISRQMVHSLNNMLFVISSYSQFIKETHSDEETQTNIKRIEVAADQCQTIMKDWRAQADKLIPDPPGT